MKKLYVVGSSSEVALSIQKLFKKEWTTNFYGRSNPHGFTNFVEYPGVEDEKSVELLKNSIIEDLMNTKGLEETALIILAGISSNDWRLSYYVNEYLPAIISDGFAKSASQIDLANRSIVLVGSSGAYQGAKLPYAATKASLTGILHTISRDYKEKVRINIVLPSAFDSGMISDWDERKRKQVSEANYIGRLGSPGDMADAILFAVRNRFVTNSTINMTGGTVHI